MRLFTQFINLRAIHEPFNHSLTIVDVDTFASVSPVHPKDGRHYKSGDMSTKDNYEATLERSLSRIESFPPMSHLREFELVKGDATVTVDRWLDENLHAIVSRSTLDMGLYESTLEVLRMIFPSLTRGSVIAFDQLNCKYFPARPARWTRP